MATAWRSTMSCTSGSGTPRSSTARGIATSMPSIGCHSIRSALLGRETWPFTFDRCGHLVERRLGRRFRGGPGGSRGRAGRPAAVRAVVQRVSEAAVSVDGEVVGAIGPGLCVLLGVTHGDDRARGSEDGGQALDAAAVRRRRGPDGRGGRRGGCRPAGHLAVHPLRRHPQGPAPDVDGGGAGVDRRAPGRRGRRRAARPWGPRSPPGGSGRRCRSRW